MMHGADPATPISVIENISRDSERIVETSLATLDADIRANELTGPAVIMFGISPRFKSHKKQSEQPASVKHGNAMEATS